MSDRPVATDALATLGTIIDDTQKRDAIHLAVIPQQAAHRMKPGAHVAVATSSGQNVGIVDPFLTRPVEEGEWFWLVIYPRVITSLRHVWAHPAFQDEVGTPAPQNKSPSERWLRDLAESVGISYGRLMDGASDWVNGRRRGDRWGTYIIGGAEMESMSVPDEFWTHYETMTGDRIEEEHRGDFFSCSC